MQFEVRGLPTAGEALDNIKIGNIFYGTEGWLELNKDKWQSYLGQKNTKGPGSNNTDIVSKGEEEHYVNFIEALRSRKQEDLNCDILEGR